jgi:hypothetical protein
MLLQMECVSLLDSAAMRHPEFFFIGTLPIASWIFSKPHFSATGPLILSMKQPFSVR